MHGQQNIKALIYIFGSSVNYLNGDGYWEHSFPKVGYELRTYKIRILIGLSRKNSHASTCKLFVV